MKHLLSDFDLSKEEIEDMLDLALEIKKQPEKFL